VGRLPGLSCEGCLSLVGDSDIARGFRGLKRFAKNLSHWFVEKRSERIDGVGVSKSTCVSS